MFGETKSCNESNRKAMKSIDETSKKKKNRVILVLNHFPADDHFGTRLYHYKK